MQKTVLVFGRHGQLTQAFQELEKMKQFDCLYPEDHVKVIFAGQDVLDFSKTSQIIPYLENQKPDLIINTSAYTAVDRAESESNAAFQVNHLALELISQWMSKNKKTLVHFSTDYVFDGTGNEARNELSLPNPLNIYGHSKLKGDQAILASGARALILRTSWVYSHVGQNFFRTMLRLGSEREELSVVNDQIGSPTYAPDLANIVLKILIHPHFRQQSGGEIYNICGTGYISWFEFASEIFKQAPEFGYHLKLKSLKPIPSSSYPTPAIRPLNSRLDQMKLKKNFMLEMPSWQKSLVSAFQNLRK